MMIQVAQRCGRISTFRDIQKLTGQDPEQPTVMEGALSRRLD